VSDNVPCLFPCVYCSRPMVQIHRGPDGCQVECEHCAHVWRSDDAEMAQELALRSFAMRATLDQ
jgi:hypothetical protein